MQTNVEKALIEEFEKYIHATLYKFFQHILKVLSIRSICNSYRCWDIKNQLLKLDI